MARKLLLADDSITIQKVVELVLAEEGFDIKSVGNGEEALAAVSAFKPDIVLADIDMPKINGYQLCEKIKTNPATKNIPVILLSGAFEPLDEELTRQVKADSYVIKPFESQELISKINASLLAPSIAEKPAAAEEEVFAEALAVGAEEDLWAMEAVEADTVPEEAAAQEKIEISEEAVEEISVAEEFEPGETEELSFAGVIEAPKEEEIIAEPVEEKIIPPPVRQAPTFAEKSIKIAAPAAALPSKDELSNIFKKATDERIASFLSTIDIKNALSSAIGAALKDSVEKILWEIAPDLTEKILREMLQSSLASLSKEVEKVIWETVPEIAEAMIAKEIEKIRSEI
ncbi:MAG: response regulator [Nitrospirae bacterium]|nr:response regulator [Nitrospirota bacterium]